MIDMHKNVMRYLIEHGIRYVNKNVNNAGADTPLAAFKIVAARGAFKIVAASIEAKS